MKARLMRVSRPVAAAPSAATVSPVSNAIPDGGISDGAMSAMHVLAAAARISEPRLVRRAQAKVAPGLAADQASLGPTVSGAGAGESHAGDHVGGAMLPATRDTVALSDGTRISFGAVAEVPEFACA
jgi:hypothetical protein